VTSRADIADQARRLVGYRFRHQGRFTSEGFDCTGIFLATAEDLGLRDALGIRFLRTDYHDYHFQPQGDLMLREARRRLFERPGGATAERQLGDVLVMRLPDDPTHVAFVTRLLGQEAMVHAYAGGSERVVEHILDRAWRNRIVAVFHFPGVEE
jgi:hypothetical protein